MYESRREDENMAGDLTVMADVDPLARQKWAKKVVQQPNKVNKKKKARK